MNRTLRILLVDDEAPARARLRNLLGDLAAQQPTEIVAEAGDGVEALERMAGGRTADVALVDIRMPRMDGMQLALHLARLPEPPALIFITAYDQYAIRAFDLSAVDYLLKPVRGPRLLEALGKARRGRPAAEELGALVPEGRRQLRSTERGRVVLIAVEEILFLRAELKYITARTAGGEFLIEESLLQLEAELGDRFVRVHRNCLVARNAIAGYERAPADAESEPHWQLLLRGVADRIPVSRRQWPAVKPLIKQ